MLALQAAAGQVTVSEELLDYITGLIQGTRRHRDIELGASPRASVALLKTSRVRAAMRGRDFVTPDDVKALALPVLRHRVLLHPDAEFGGLNADAAVAAVVEQTPVPDAARG